MSVLELLLTCLLVAGLLVTVVTARKVILAYLAEDYLICPICGRQVLHLGTRQKCQKCKTIVVAKERGRC